LQKLFPKVYQSCTCRYTSHTTSAVLPLQPVAVSEAALQDESEFAYMMEVSALPPPISEDILDSPEDIADKEVQAWLNYDPYKSDIGSVNQSKNPMLHLKTFSPLDFWEDNKQKFPLLYRLACRYLLSPCAESFAERMFSSGGALAGNCSIETVERRIQMRVNSRFLEKSFGLLRKVKVPGGYEYLLNLDKVKHAIEDEEFGDSIED